jgi:hypothetical protein
MQLVPLIVSILPALAAHGELGNFARNLYASQNSAAKSQILTVLQDYYPQICDARPANCIRSAAVQFARSYSHYFSFHTFDTMFGVERIEDLSFVLGLLFSDLMKSGFLEVESLMELIGGFCEVNCMADSSVFMINIFVRVAVSIESDDHWESMWEIMHSLLKNRLIAGSEFLLAIFSVDSNSFPPSVSRLISLFIDAIRDLSSVITVNEILTEPVVRAFKDSDSFTNLLAALREYPPPIISRSLRECIELSVCGSPFLASLFSLLPEPLLSSDFGECFDFFVSNVSQTTFVFWALWLEHRPYYINGFPVTPITPDSGRLARHRQGLISAFAELFTGTADDDQTLFVDCWTLICQNRGFAEAIAANLIRDLRLSRLSLYLRLVDFVQPALAHLEEETYESLIDGSCRYAVSLSEFDAFVTFAAPVLMVYVWRFPLDTVFVPLIADTLLEWIPPLGHGCSRGFEFIIDCFNFIIAYTNIQDDSGEFQEVLHAAVIGRINRLPTEIQRLILLNQPLRRFEPCKDPLFADLKLPRKEPEPPPEPERLYRPSPPDDAVPGPFDDPLGSLSGNDDDYPAWQW